MEQPKPHNQPSEDSPSSSGQDEPVSAQPVHGQPSTPRYPTPPSRRPRSALWIVLVLLLLGGLGVLAVGGVIAVAASKLATSPSQRRVTEEFFSHNRYGSQKIAILTLEGIIMDEDDGFVKRQIDRARRDDDVKAIVLRINSPGGTISDSDYLYHHLRKLAEEQQIPIVASMGGIAASGGYYVAMAVGDTPKSIYAEPTTFTGSIGVIIPHYDLSELLNEWGVQYNSIASGELKGMGSMAKPMTEEEREVFQTLVDQGFERFKSVIRQGRPRFQQNPDTLDKLATGQIYTSQQAEENGLVDGIGFLEEAVDRAIEVAGLDPDDVKVVRYKPEPSLASLITGAQSARRELDLQTLVQLSTPRAYYLCTWLPPLTSRP